MTLRHAAIALAALGLAGCGYTTRGLFPEDVRTVAVPIFKSDGFRRDIEFLVTEKVIQAIESQTPYKVVAEADADSTLKGQISNFYKNPFGEDGFDNPRGGDMILILSLAWIDNRSGEVIHERSGNVTIQANQSFSIDTAQSSATAVHKAAEQIASEVVSILHSPW